MEYWTEEARKLELKNNIELPTEPANCITNEDKDENLLIGFFEDEDLYEFFRLQGIDWNHDEARGVCILTCDGVKYEILSVDIDNRRGVGTSETILKIDSLVKI